MHGWLLLLLALLALTPVHTKLAGLLWVLTTLAAAWWSWRQRHGQLNDDAVSRAARRWWLACSGTLLLWQAMALYWQEPCCEYSSDLNAALRWWLGALAAWGLVRRFNGDAHLHRRIHDALALAGLASLLVVLTHDRLELPSYPIPWSASVAMLIVLLFPGVLRAPEGSWMRRAGLAGCLAALLAVLLSQSRGTYVILAWMVYHWARHASAGFSWRDSIRPSLAAVMLMLGIVASGIAPSDPLRMREGWNDIAASWREANYNTSLGGRFALYQLAADSVMASPWSGVGARERLERIASLGLDQPEPQRSLLSHARQQGHVHNAYLHNAMDGGLPGLAGFLLTILGLLLAARTIQRSHALASQQLQGLAFVHTLTSISNVNHAHNYYVVMLSLSVLVVFVLARCQPADQRSSA